MCRRSRRSRSMSSAISARRLPASRKSPQRPLDEVARFLGGVESTDRGRRSSPRDAAIGGGRGRRYKKDDHEAQEEIADEFAVHRGPVKHRPVTIVDAGAKKMLRLSIEV